MSRWQTVDRADAEASDGPTLDPPPGFPSGEAIFEDAVTDAVEAAVEALHELPTEAWVTWRLADIVRDAAITALDMYETARESADVVDDDEMAAAGVLAAWHRHIRESAAFTTCEGAVQMCDRMDAATGATREHLETEWNARTGRATRLADSR